LIIDVLRAGCADARFSGLRRETMKGIWPAA
jgi:hypothetical protein